MQNENIVSYEVKVSGEPLYDQDLIEPPWSIDINDFNRIDNRELIDRTINVIKNDHVLLVLTSEDGKRFGNTILIVYDDETLSIDRPFDFDEKTVVDFRIYFKDILDTWSFFETKVISDCPYTLCSTYPENIYRLQRRKYKRASAPFGTRAVFWHDDKIHDAGYVKDISATGMLLCTRKEKPHFQDESNIREIAIALPRHPSSDKIDMEGKILLPTIKKGRIVRSFREKDTDWICHGISFEDNPDVQRKLNSFVTQHMKEEAIE